MPISVRLFLTAIACKRLLVSNATNADLLSIQDYMSALRTKVWSTAGVQQNASASVSSYTNASKSSRSRQDECSNRSSSSSSQGSVVWPWLAQETSCTDHAPKHLSACVDSRRATKDKRRIFEASITIAFNLLKSPGPASLGIIYKSRWWKSYFRPKRCGTCRWTL